jgi:hypothetical protein
MRQYAQPYCRRKLRIHCSCGYRSNNHLITAQTKAQIFNHLVAQFRGSIRNKGPIKKTGRLKHHFEVFGIMTAVVFVEAKLELGTTAERMDVIAQVIAECFGQLDISA